MREHKQSRIILSLLLGLILLACLPVCAFADTSELSDGDEARISLSTKVPPSVVSGDGAAYTKGFIKGLEHYAINHHIDYKNIIELEIDLAPFQPNCHRAINYVRTIVIAHKYDWVAKHRPMKGTIYN